MNTEQSLLHLGQRTSEAVQGILRMYAATGVVAGTVTVIAPGQNPFEDVEMPCVAAEVSYVDGVTGGNTLMVGTDGARRMAAAMMGADPMGVEAGGELDEMEFSAVGEAMNQMMAATAMATGEVLGDEVEIGPPELKKLTDVAEAVASWEHVGHAAVVTFTFCGTPCLLVQAVPNAFIVRMTRALDEQTAGHDEDQPFSDGLRDVKVRVWAELGRTRMASGRAVDLPPGAVIELDRLVDDCVDVYVDGMRFASCRLMVTDDGGLAMRLEEIYGLEAEAPASTEPPEAADAPEPPEAPDASSPEEVPA